MTLSMIAAMASNRVIGLENRLPWKIPEDLRHFRAVTTGRAVIMGRKTFESIGRPLPNRRNIVLSRNGVSYAGVDSYRDLESAIAACRDDDEAFVIGGGEVYRLAMPRVDRIYLTLIHQNFDGDARLPEWQADAFTETSRRESEHEGIRLSFLRFDRKRG